LIWIRNSFPAIRQNVFFSGSCRNSDDDLADLSWYRPDGSVFKIMDWQNSDNRAFQALFAAPNDGTEGSDRDVLIVINGRGRLIDVTLPSVRKFERIWNSRFETPRKFELLEKVKVAPFSMQVFVSVKE
jgi:pullulanase/glycogen debranching enzyme